MKRNNIVESLTNQLTKPVKNNLPVSKRISLEDQIEWWKAGGNFNEELYKQLLIVKS